MSKSILTPILRPILQPILRPVSDAVASSGGVVVHDVDVVSISFEPAASHDVPLPPSVASGDLLVIIITAARTLGSEFVDPTGWDVIHNSGHGTMPSAVYSRAATGSEGSVQTIELTSAAACAAIVYRIAAGTYVGSPEIEVESGVGTDPAPPELEPSWGSAQTRWLAAFCGRRPAGLTGYSLPDHRAYSATSGTNLNHVEAAASSAMTAGGAFTPPAYEKTSVGDWRAMTIAIEAA